MKLRLGLFGFEVVGEGLYDIFRQTEGFDAEIVKTCVKNPAKSRTLPSGWFTFEPDEILQDPDINLVVEMINHPDEAHAIVCGALRQGKAVVSACKQMLAERLEDIVQWPQQFCSPLLYKAAVCGSIPIIRNLEEYDDNELLHSLSGIVNVYPFHDIPGKPLLQHGAGTGGRLCRNRPRRRCVGLRRSAKAVHPDYARLRHFYKA